MNQRNIALKYFKKGLYRLFEQNDVDVTMNIDSCFNAHVIQHQGG